MGEEGSTEMRITASTFQYDTLCYIQYVVLECSRMEP